MNPKNHEANGYEHFKGQFTWGPKVQVLLISTSPNMETKSQLLSLKKQLKYGLYSLESDL